MTASDMAREKARQLRWKRPIVKDLNLDTIKTELYEMAEDCYSVRYAIDEEGDDNLAELLGDEEDAWQFKMQFSDLESGIDKLRNDIEEIWRFQFDEEDVDSILVAANGHQYGGGLIGYDSFEEDYYPLDSIMYDFCANDQEKKISRLKKSELIDLMEEALHVVIGYTSICYRFNCLKAAMDIIMSKQGELIANINAVCDAYDAAESVGFRNGWTKEEREFQRLIDALPDQVWIQ